MQQAELPCRHPVTASGFGRWEALLPLYLFSLYKKEPHIFPGYFAFQQPVVPQSRSQVPLWPFPGDLFKVAQQLEASSAKVTSGKCPAVDKAPAMLLQEARTSHLLQEVTGRWLQLLHGLGKGYPQPRMVLSSTHLPWPVGQKAQSGSQGSACCDQVPERSSVKGGANCWVGSQFQRAWVKAALNH